MRVERRFALTLVWLLIDSCVASQEFGGMRDDDLSTNPVKASH